MNRVRALRSMGLTAVLLCMDLACASHAGTGALPLVAVADIPLGGGTTRMDYESYDTSRHLLFIAHLGDSAVIAFDTRAKRVVARIPGIAAVHGVLVIPELGRVYASATGTNEIAAIEEGTLKVSARAPAGVYPDGIAYAPDVHKLYISDEFGASVTVVDVISNTRKVTIPLGGEVGNIQYDPASRHIFANVQTRGQLAEIDPATDSVVARIDLPGAKGNHGLLIESRLRLAFIACENNDTMLVLNLATKKVIASYNVGVGADVLAFDPGLAYLYVASESGVVSVFNVGAGVVTKVGEGPVAPHAHVVTVDPGTHRVYFPLMNLGGHAVLRIMHPQP